MSSIISRSAKVEIKAFVPNENSCGCIEKVNNASLIDGIKATSDYNDEAWNRFFLGLGREIIVDLGGVFAVDGIDAGFLHDRSNNIFCPESVRVLLSENGVDYYPVTVIDAPYPASFGMAARARYSADFGCAYRAEFVKLVFSVEELVYCDEISVFGSECNGFESSFRSSPENLIHKNAYADRNAVGAGDIVMIPYGTIGERYYAIKSEELLPYLAHIDTDGRITDTMFDAAAFVPARISPFGGSFDREGGPTTLDGWKYLIDELFADGINLCALDDAVRDLKKWFGMPDDYKYKVFLAAPVPKISLQPFGDINGDGIEDKLITTEDCVNAYLWFVDEVKRRFDRLGLKNITVDGWIWNEGTLSRERKDDEPEFAKACVTALHERGYKCIFTSDFQSGFAEKADDIGFDLTVMNGGVDFGMFSENVEGVLDDLSSVCRKYGFGIEIDLRDSLSSRETAEDSFKTLYTVFTKSVKNGLADAPRLYRLSPSHRAVFDCAVSRNRNIRMAYDKLYRFIKGASLGLPETVEENIAEEIIGYVPDSVVEETVEENISTVEESTVEENIAEESIVEELPEEIESASAVFEENKPEEINEPEKDFIEPKKPEIKREPVIEKREKNSPNVTNIKIDVNSEPNCKKCCETKRSNDKKMAIGLGIAAAAGALFIISRLFKDDKGR